ncbi:DUF2975 domain-containing protein [Winogradskyella echinorum]|uniref:DUF2975 domain-containing protein n=1 Tax=Winogradskyella echinorum TaxID=538189 RepID=A0ABR6XYI1_9FLAO|nr:DUF2975 domain-containing protein [Winogradskyella echinorum]MBC3845541.1 DUF2975 domain-containing protein [Winogradskyella echinorum]MBC5749889.1 DUF2975 domain-containing protein [Winogradskyella echinorum]
MTTIRLLKNLINILFWGMIVFSVLSFILFIMLLFFPESLPRIFQPFGMFFNGNFPWQLWIVQFSNILGFLLFIVSIYYLKKCINPLEEQRFYSDEVIVNLKKTGRLFIIITIVTTLLRIIGLFVFNDLTNNMMVGSKLGTWAMLSSIASAIGYVNFFLLIIGLFLLVFSTVFNNGKLLKEENDLTI